MVDVDVDVFSNLNEMEYFVFVVVANAVIETTPRTAPPGHKPPLLQKRAISKDDMPQEVVFLLHRKHLAPQNLTINTESLKSSGYDVTKPLKMIAFGGHMPDFSSMCAREYARKDEVNVVVLDLGKYTPTRDDVKAVDNFRAFGEFLVEFVSKLTSEGADTRKMHLIGSEILAHLLGFVGRNVQDGKIGRITGLNPTILGKGYGLSKDDADFVDVIHTYFSTGVEITGHADFFPNGGSHQPGCMDTFCNIDRSWLYFTESVNSKTPFTSYKCRDWESFEDGRTMCMENTVPMGEHVPNSTCGDYYLRTASGSPFALGDDNDESVSLRISLCCVCLCFIRVILI